MPVGGKRWAEKGDILLWQKSKLPVNQTTKAFFSQLAVFTENPREPRGLWKRCHSGISSNPMTSFARIDRLSLWPD